MLGYDRVMIYRFAHDGAGQVVSEAKRGDLESFLGQYFPASDIPQQARALYLRNTVRIISDASGERIPIVPVLDASGEPLDLSYAHLRSVSPIHLRVSAQHGRRRLDVDLDHRRRRAVGTDRLPPLFARARCRWPQRVAAEMFGDFFSLHLEALKQKRKLDRRSRARRSLDRVLQLASHQADIAEVLRDNLADFDQAHVVRRQSVSGSTATGSARASRRPRRPFPRLAASSVRCAEGKIGPRTRCRSGCPEPPSLCRRRLRPARHSAVAASTDYLFFFRKEVVQTLELGGQSGKILRDRPARRPADPAQELRDLEGDGAKPGRSPGPNPTAKSPKPPVSRWSKSLLRHNEMSPTNAAGPMCASAC